MAAQMISEIGPRLKSIEERAFECEVQIRQLEGAARVFSVMSRTGQLVEEFDVEDLSHMMQLFVDILGPIRRDLADIANEAEECNMGRVKSKSGKDSHPQTTKRRRSAKQSIAA